MPGGDVTQLLQRWSEGDRDAIDQLTPLVYTELRRLAHRRLLRERPDHSLNSTELVHEAYLRMVDQTKARYQDRAHFFAICARIMRRILVDHARAHLRQKRGGGNETLALNESIDVASSMQVELAALDDALDSLAKLDPQQSRIIELRFFTGLSLQETADVLGISVSTVHRDWVVARAWMTRELARR